MHETELWSRLGTHLGGGYAGIWAEQMVLDTLDNRTVTEALAAGVPCKIVWRAVWSALELPAKDR